MGAIEVLDWASLFIGAAMAAGFAALSFFRAQGNKGGPLFFYLLTGFYACVFLSNAYYLLSWLAADYPYVISPGDLSWVGAIVFMITAALVFKDNWTPEQKETANKYRIPALAAPAVCVLFNAAYFRIYPELMFNYLLYGIPTATFAYLALWLFLANGRSGRERLYHLAALSWIAVQLFYDLFSTLGTALGFGVHFTVCSYLLTAAAICVYFAAKKGAGE